MSDPTIDFYNTKSGDYSATRYPKITENFVQYMFKKRLELFLKFLEKIEKDLPLDATILDIGCADGVTFKIIEEGFPGRFAQMVGMDISPKMIETAKRQNNNPRAQFFLKNELPDQKFSIIVELGVHPFDLNKELVYATKHLSNNGHFFYSVVGSRSLHVKRNLSNTNFLNEYKARGDNYLEDYMMYKDYESFFKKFFSIVARRGYSIFVPKLWKLPIIGRIFQPLFDSAFRLILPELFHERIYLLKKKK